MILRIGYSEIQGRKGVYSVSKKFFVINAGIFFDTLKVEYVKVEKTAGPFNRVANSSVPIERKSLDKTESIDVFQKINMTVSEVFASAGIPIVLSEQEQKILSALENMKDTQLEFVTSCIHQICESWWVGILDLSEEETLSSVARFKQFALHKYPASAEKIFENCPYLQSIFPFRLLTKISTDDFPQLCLESGIPVSFLMDLPISKVHFYSTNTNVDRAFTEYRMIYSDALRSIIERIIFKKINQNG